MTAARLERFGGILNSTTDLSLTDVDQGNSFKAAMKRTKDLASLRPTNALTCMARKGRFTEGQ